MLICVPRDHLDLIYFWQFDTNCRSDSKFKWKFIWLSDWIWKPIELTFKQKSSDSISDWIQNSIGNSHEFPIEPQMQSESDWISDWTQKSIGKFKRLTWPIEFPIEPQIQSEIQKIDKRLNLDTYLASVSTYIYMYVCLTIYKYKY